MVPMRKWLYLLPIAIMLSFMGFNNCYAQQSARLIPTDDAFVVTNYNDPNDTEGLQSINTGNYTYIKVWYSWQTTRINEEITSVGYMKFDLSGINSENVIKADLMMFPYIVELTNSSRDIEVVPVSGSNWTESKINFHNAPRLIQTPPSYASLSSPNTWYDWDITDIVKKKAGSKVSLIILPKAIYPGNHENIAFYSKDAANKTNAPYLEITTSGSAFPLGLSQGSQDYSLYIITGGLAAAGIAFAIFLRNRGMQKSKPEVISDASTKKESIHSPTSIKQESEASQTSGNLGGNISETVQCKKCGKTILEGFRICPYCGSVRNVNFPL